jgi:putative tricarboxylic transport membrane protein
MTEARLRLSQKQIGRLIIGVVALALSIGYLIQALGMPRGDIITPGPGMYPVGVGLAAIAISVIVIIEALVSKANAGNVDMPSGVQRKQVLIFAGTLVAFVALLPLLGQYIAGSIYVVAVLKFLGNYSWVRSVLLGIAIGAGISVLFVEILDIALPRPIWD